MIKRIFTGLLMAFVIKFAYSHNVTNIEEMLVSQTAGAYTSAYKTAFKYPKKTFFELNFSWSPQPQMAYGVTVGQFKRTGWYGSLLSNFRFKGINTKLVSDRNGLINNELPFYSGNTSTTRISITAGFIGKIVPPWAVYAGAGLGYRALFWETIDKQWVKNKYYSTFGIDVEGGFLFDIKGFILSVGAITTNFKRFDLKVGIGVAFKHDRNSSKNRTQMKCPYK